ncbi:hypothetical protein BH11BAC2_BH11BAC2_01440 [soil metagenome]
MLADLRGVVYLAGYNRIFMLPMKKLLLSLLVILGPLFVSAQCTTNNATTCACKDGTQNCDLLPDIEVARPPLLVNGNSGYIEYPQVCVPPCSGNDGRLRLSVSTPNIGFGPLEVRALPTAICGTDTFYNVPSNFTCPNGQPLKQLVVQRVYHKTNGVMSYYDRPAGTMTYHPSHGHMHVDDWGIYTIRTATADPNPLNWPILGTGSKLAFCLMDYGTCSTYNGHCVDSVNNTLLNANFPNFSLGGGSYGCSPTVQGISSGYTDIYYQSLDGMWINLPPGLCNGNYWIVVQLDPYNYFAESNENNNVLATPVTLTQQNGAAPTITSSGPTSFCQGSSVTLTSAAAGSYLWSTGATTQSITVNQSGSYSVTINGNTSCSGVSAPVVVTVNPVVVSATATPNATCPGDVVQLNAVASGNGVSYQAVNFTNNTPVFIPDNNATGATSIIAVSGISPLSLNTTSVVSVTLNLTHTYDGDLEIRLIAPSGNTIILSDNRGGSGDNFTNTVFSASAATLISSGTAPFNGAYRPDAAFSALTGNANGNWKLLVIDQANVDTGRIVNWTLSLNNQIATTFSYNWNSSPAGYNSAIQNPTPSPLSTTTYNVTAVESGTGCIGNTSVTVSVGGNLNVTTNTPADICDGESTTLTASGATAYVWSPSSGLSSTTGASVTASPASTTTYRVIGTSSGCSDTAYVVVNVNPLPVVTTNTPSSICAGSTTTLTAAGASTYVWSPSTGLNTNVGSSVIAAPASTTNYIVTGTANGCSATALVTVTIDPLPIVTVNTPAAICPGQIASLNASGASTYSWSPADGLSSTTGASVTAIPAVTTTYIVTGTNGNCSSTASVTVTVNDLPAAPVAITGNGIGCLPFNGSFSIAAIPGATNYTWSVPAGVTISGGQGSSSITTTNTASRTGAVCVVANNGCGSSAAVCTPYRSTTAAPSTPGSVVGPTRACPGDVITYSVPLASNAASYNWNVPVGCVVQSGQGSNTIVVQFVAGFVGGNLSVSAINGCGTSSARLRSVALNTPVVPGAMTGAVTGVCNTTQVYSVPAISGITYTWTVPFGASIVTGQGTNSVSVSFVPGYITGNISVTASNNCGTSGARSKSVKAIPAQPVSISGAVNICTGQTGVIYTTANIVGASSYLWTVPSGATIVSGQGTTSITVNFGNTPRIGNVVVKAVNDCGVSANRALSVTISACPKIADFSNTGSAVLNLFPNPANSYVEIIFNTEKETSGQLRLQNILGQFIYQQVINPTAGQNSYMVDLRKLPAGVYIVSIEQEGRSFTKRLVVE